jgi:serine/threonine-protein kinase
MSSDDRLRPTPPTVKVVVTGEEEAGDDRAAPAADLLLAGRYRIGRRIGKGGMGEVMAARDEQVGRDVALKRMRAANPSPRAIARFVREASIQGRLEHPAVVPVHEIGTDEDGLPFFVMKKLAGTSVAKLLDEGDASRQRLLRALADVCLAVELAHVRGIVHRDLKPDNIMLGDFGEVYVLDWGVAKVTGEEDGDFGDVGSGSGEHATGTGVAIGTPGYMAPEQVVGAADIDGRADVYTLGCLLFEILAGEPLHPRGPEGLKSALEGVDARPSARAPWRAIPPELDLLCVDATRTERDARIQTARELGHRIQLFLDGDRDLALRRRLAAEHLVRARGAFEGGASEDERRTAMREAAGALALDPTLSGAAELVGRLMLEPPSVTPREVREAVVADDVRASRQIARAGMWTIVASLAFMPLCYWMAPAGSRAPWILTALLVGDGLFALLAFRARLPRAHLMSIANAVIVIAIARMYSPILVAPGIAASLAMAMVLTPPLSWLCSAAGQAVLMIGAVLGPLVLERLGVLASTMSVTSSGVWFHASGLGTRDGPTTIVAALYAVAVIGTACFAGGVLRASTRKAHHALQLQAWQLRQLVPAA